MKCAKFDYGTYVRARNDCATQFGHLFDLPILHNRTRKIVSYYTEGNILDLGAGNALKMAKLFEPILRNGTYYSLDEDPSGTFSFRSVADIPESLEFSLIIADQFFEHLEINDAIEIITKVSEHLSRGGCFVVSVPNISHPIRFFADITHKTWWEFDAVYMLFKYANLDVDAIMRFSKRHPKGLISKIVAHYMRAIYGMDWCDSIMVVGSKGCSGDCDAV